jgi:hypothetical protein
LSDRLDKNRRESSPHHVGACKSSVAHEHWHGVWLLYPLSVRSFFPILHWYDETTKHWQDICIWSAGEK